MTEIDRGLLEQSIPIIQGAQNVFLRDHEVGQPGWFVAEQDPERKTGVGIYTVCENGSGQPPRLMSYVLGYTFARTVKIPPTIVKAVPFEGVDSVQEVAGSLPGDLEVTWERLSESIVQIAAERAFGTGGVASRLEFGKGRALAVEMFDTRFPSRESEEVQPRKMLAARRADLEERIASEMTYSAQFERSCIIRDDIKVPILRRFHTDLANGLEEIHYLDQKYGWLIGNEAKINYRLASILKMDDENRDQVTVLPASVGAIERTEYMYEAVDKLIAEVKAGNLHFGSFKLKDDPRRPGSRVARIFCEINGQSHLFATKSGQVDECFNTSSQEMSRPQHAVFKIIESKVVPGKKAGAPSTNVHMCIIVPPFPNRMPNYFYNGTGRYVSYAEDILSETPGIQAFRSPVYDGGKQFNSRRAIFTTGEFLNK